MMKGVISCTLNTSLQEVIMKDLHIEVNGKIEAMEGNLGQIATLEQLCIVRQSLMANSFELKSGLIQMIQ